MPTPAKALKIFISHSFDHPEKFARLVDFVHREGVRHFDHSIPAWDPYQGPDVQAEIQRRIQRCDRLVVIITDGIHKSPWINQEIDWARAYRKPIIGVYDHGHAGAPIPAALAAADPTLIGWRGTTLARALRDHDVTGIRALDLAEDADRDRLITTMIAGGAIASVLMVGADLLALHKVRADLERRGYLLDTRPTNLILPTLGGTIVGAIIGYILGHVFGRTSTAPRNFALGGAALGGAYSLHRVLKAELKNLGPLTELALQPIPALPPAPASPSRPSSQVVRASRRTHLPETAQLSGRGCIIGLPASQPPQPNRRYSSNHRPSPNRRRA